MAKKKAEKSLPTAAQVKAYSTHFQQIAKEKGEAAQAAALQASEERRAAQQQAAEDAADAEYEFRKAVIHADLQDFADIIQAFDDIAIRDRKETSASGTIERTLNWLLARFGYPTIPPINYITGPPIADAVGGKIYGFKPWGPATQGKVTNAAGFGGNKF